ETAQDQLAAAVLAPYPAPAAHMLEAHPARAVHTPAERLLHYPAADALRAGHEMARCVGRDEAPCEGIPEGDHLETVIDDLERSLICGDARGCGVRDQQQAILSAAHRCVAEGQSDDI